MTRGLVQWMVFVDLTTRDVVAIITLAARNHSSGLGPPRGPTSLCIRCRGVLAIFNPTRDRRRVSSARGAATRRNAPTDRRQPFARDASHTRNTRPQPVRLHCRRCMLLLNARSEVMSLPVQLTGPTARWCVRVDKACAAGVCLGPSRPGSQFVRRRRVHVQVVKYRRTQKIVAVVLEQVDQLVRAAFALLYEQQCDVVALKGKCAHDIEFGALHVERHEVNGSGCSMRRENGPNGHEPYLTRRLRALRAVFARDD